MSVGRILLRTEQEKPIRLNNFEKMSNLTFRPRPIDILKQMPIIRTEADMDYEGVSRSVPQMPTGMDPEDEEEQHIQEAIARSLQPSLQPSEIPTPNCRIVEAYINEKVEPWEQKTTFVRYNDPTESDLERLVEYDLDSEDMRFLRELNSVKKLLTEDALEFLIDRLEKYRRRCKLKGDANFNVTKAEKLLGKEKHPHNIKPAALAATFKYWQKKRDSRSVALIPRFQKPPDFNDPSPLVAFRPREPAIKQKKVTSKQPQFNRKNDASSFNKLTALRREFERARMLLEMIKKREKTKRERIGVLRDIFECKLTEPAPERERKKRRKIERSGTTTAKPAKRSKTEKTYGFDISTSSSEPPSPGEVPLSPAPPPVDTPELTELIQSAPPCPYPVCLGRRLAIGGNVPLFRGRARIGRGGRLIFDRYAIPWVTLRANGSYPVSEEEWEHAMEEMEEQQATSEQINEEQTKEKLENPLDNEGEKQGVRIEKRNGENTEMGEVEDTRSEKGVGESNSDHVMGFLVKGVMPGEKTNGKRYFCDVQQKPDRLFEFEDGEESSFSKRLREISNMADGEESEDELLQEADDELSDADTNVEEEGAHATWELNSSALANGTTPTDRQGMAL